MDASPAGCLEAWAAQKSSGRPFDAKAVKKQANENWRASLAARLKRFEEQRVAAVIVDVGANGGGNDSGDWAARMFTAKDVQSAPMWVSAAKVSIPNFDEQLATRACPMSWVWRERRAWTPSGCSRLIDAGFASGYFGYLPPNALVKPDRVRGHLLGRGRGSPPRCLDRADVRAHGRSDSFFR